MSELAKARSEANDQASLSFRDARSSAASAGASRSPLPRPGSTGAEKRALEFELGNEREENNLLKQRFVSCVVVSE